MQEVFSLEGLFIVSDLNEILTFPQKFLYQKVDYVKLTNPLLYISVLRLATPDEALQVIRYTIEPQIAADDRMERLRTCKTS